MRARFGDGHGRTAAICFFGVAMRIAFHVLGFQPYLEGAWELVIPSASWNRAREGLFLGSLGLSHYAGGVFTGSPLTLGMVYLCSKAPMSIEPWLTALLLAAFDVASALLIRTICFRVMAVETTSWENELEHLMDDEMKPPTHNRENNSPNGDDVSKATTSRRREASWPLPDLVVAAYMLNPLLAAQCSALSGDVIGRVFLLAAFASSMVCPRRPSLIAAFLALAACLWRFYSAAMIVPLALLSCRRDSINGCGPFSSEGAQGSGESIDKQHRGEQSIDAKKHVKSDPASQEYVSQTHVPRGLSLCPPDPCHFEVDPWACLSLFFEFTIFCAIVLVLCWLATSRSWDFLRSAIGGQLLCEDLTPNKGLYWYLFAEVFQRFRGFFRVLFLSHPYIYVIPATIRLGMFPEALAHLLFAIFGLFQPYPTLGDISLTGCLFLCHPRTAARMRLVLPTILCSIIPALLLPTMRHLWLQAGTGNANFYYFQTVILNVFLSVFVLQFVAALVKRRKALSFAYEKQREALAGRGENTNQIAERTAQVRT